MNSVHSQYYAEVQISRSPGSKVVILNFIWRHSKWYKHDVRCSTYLGALLDVVCGALFIKFALNIGVQMRSVYRSLEENSVIIGLNWRDYGKYCSDLIRWVFLVFVDGAAALRRDAGTLGVVHSPALLRRGDLKQEHWTLSTVRTAAVSKNELNECKIVQCKYPKVAQMMKHF